MTGTQQRGDGLNGGITVSGIDDDVEHLVPAVECLQQGIGDITTGGSTIQIGHAPTLDPSEALLVV